ncbi:alpha-2-macroglobulin, partial [candidate division KSB1 bacterium]
DDSFLDENDEVIQKYISAYTAGEISRESIIQIQFRSDVADSSQVNEILYKSPLTFDPSINGDAVWTDTRTLVFRPVNILPGARDYTATIDLNDIIKDFDSSGKFRFAFATIQQTFEVEIDGLESSDPADSRPQQLRGNIVTADAANGIDVEKILLPEFKDEELDIRWSHSQSRRIHTFIISGIMRDEIPTEVILNFDGEPIESDKKDKMNITIPQLDEFDVLQVRPVQDEEQYVEIRFTDLLQRNQNLNGLIRIDRVNNLRFAIDNNILRVYSTAQWPAEVNVNIEPGIRNYAGERFENAKLFNITFEELKPQVRFTGDGVILPTTMGATIPIEVVNLNAVIIEAVRIYEDNIPQFFQVNNYEGIRELNRVGDTVWKKTVPLNFTPDKKNRWVRYGLDVEPLIQDNPGGIYRITLTFERSHIVYDSPVGKFDWDEIISRPYNYRDYNTQRLNPYHPAFYRRYYDHDITISRNVFVSDIGLIAKRDSDNNLLVAVTDLKSTEPMPNVSLELLDFQQQKIGSAETNNSGIAVFSSEKIPHLVMASHGGQKGYLRLDERSALAFSHFDVAGETILEGIKGYIYGERGVWRPGDNIFLTFVLMDPDNRFPDNYPVQFEFFNPRGQLVTTMVDNNSLNGFYRFSTATDPDAPTGNWKAQVKVGGVTFEKIVKVETVMPNRLKIDLSFEGDRESLTEGDLNAELSAAWLHGATARNLISDIKLDLTSVKTVFPDFEEYVFDDPVLQFSSESRTLYEGELDETGKSIIKTSLKTNNTAPGMLKAQFNVRVFEPGGAFSVDRFDMPYHPYKNYIGLSIPDEDPIRIRLSPETPHEVNIVSLDNDGQYVPSGNVEIKLYNLRWRWWFQSGRESLANYLRSISYRAIETDTVNIEDGRGEWSFNLPQGGRYLVRTRDLENGHISGKIFYMDWSRLAYQSMSDIPGGANILSFSSDKEEYSVGETVKLTIPTGRKGRVLISIESGSKILQTNWIEAGELPAEYEFTATDEMAPNVYLHATFIQPHLQTDNDLPIRMYGIIPIKVVNPATQLNPVLEVPDVFVPEQTARISVSESDSKPMTYTLAVVDEGLLDLTRFVTPDPWNNFYRREALGIKTWDFYDNVVGAFGGTLEKFLAIGGDEGLDISGNKRANRFPPMVLFRGPFELKEGETNNHDLDIPQYVGSVRVMVVAGQDGAFGSSEETAFVRKPLMILGTLPRVLGPGERVDLPVSVFAMEDNVRDVTINIQAEGSLTVDGASEKQVSFTETGDKLVEFSMKAAEIPGVGSVTIQASSGSENAQQNIELDIRMPTFSIVTVEETFLEQNETWNATMDFPGVEGTNKAVLEVSRIPPINLEQRINFLIRYPYGCVEQTTSSVFPQLYLNKFLELSSERQVMIEQNIIAAIQRLRLFQTVDGAFGYWPAAESADSWGTNYAGHFLIEAQRAGYNIPQIMLQQWLKFQKAQALSWTNTEYYRAPLIQAYRLYTLALAGAPELGAMNRLKERSSLSLEARWRLAAAYQLAGQPEAAEELTTGQITIEPYKELSFTYGSDIRDKAMIVETLCLLDQRRRALPLVEEISSELGSNTWMSTQTIAYSLIALANFTGLEEGSLDLRFTYSWRGSASMDISTTSPIIQLPLDVANTMEGTITLENAGNLIIYPRIVMEGVPPVGSEIAGQNKMSIDVKYLSLDDDEIDPSDLEQGTDFIVEVTVRNTGVTGAYQEVALSQMFPSGWEIHNERMDPTSITGQADFNYRDIRDDRIYTFFDINQAQSKTYRVLINASYIGEFYLPMISAEAMYDASIYARLPGQWIQIVKPGMLSKENN